MWVGVGVLLGLVVAVAVLGFHTGPHGHLAAAVLGLAAALWLVVMAATGHTEPIVWVLLGADVAATGALGALGWRGLTTPVVRRATQTLGGAEGVAVSDLVPEGVVRVRGEDWSATSLNGPAPAGTVVQVVEIGVRLGVWCDVAPEDAEPHDTGLAAGGEDQGVRP